MGLSIVHIALLSLMGASAAIVGVRFRGSSFGAFASAGIGLLVIAGVLFAHASPNPPAWAALAKAMGYALLLVAFARYAHAGSRESPAVQRSAGTGVSKSKFVATFVAGFLAPLAAMTLATVPALGGRPTQPLGGAAVLLIGIAVVLGPVVSLVSLGTLLHRMWVALEGYERRMSPLLAVWGHLIPIFGLYVAFQAWSGWTIDYNRAAAKMESRAPAIPLALPVSIYALSIALLFGVPALRSASAGPNERVLVMLGSMLLSGTIGLIAVFVAVACDGINALASKPTEKVV